MPKTLKEGERLNFRKMISEPTILKSIKILSETHKEDLYKAAYRLMKLGSETICNKKAAKI